MKRLHQRGNEDEEEEENNEENEDFLSQEQDDVELDDDDDDDEEEEDNLRNESDSDGEQNVRNKLTDVPFEQILAASKRGHVTKPPLAMHNNERQNLPGQPPRKRIKLAAKSSKSAPAELPANIPVPRLRQVVQPARRIPPRDPRFDGLGQFDEHMFTKAYGFLDEMKKSEIEELKQQLRREHDPEKAATLRASISQGTQALQAKALREKERARKRQWHKAMEERVAHGKQPFFPKKSQIKQTALVDKFEEIAQSRGQRGVQRAVSKRLAKVAKKEKPRIPYKRQH